MRTYNVSLSRMCRQNDDTWAAIENGKQASLVLPFDKPLKANDELVIMRSDNWIRARITHAGPVHCLSQFVLVTFEVMAAGKKEADRASMAIWGRAVI